VILDLSLPGVGGIEIISRLKSATPDVRILILSMHSDLIHADRALQAGAAGYISSKQAPPEEVLTAIRRVAAGHTYVEHDIAEELVFANIQAPAPALTELSSRDLEILRFLAEGSGLPQIANMLGISYKTAPNGCSQLKAKLRASTTADLIRIAIQLRLTDRDASLTSCPSHEGE
jgi:two-component system, NarL family, invasion response regulator UvrY